MRGLVVSIRTEMHYRQINSLERQLLYFDSSSDTLYTKGPIVKKASFGLDNNSFSKPMMA